MSEPKIFLRVLVFYFQDVAYFRPATYREVSKAVLVFTRLSWTPSAVFFLDIFFWFRFESINETFPFHSNLVDVFCLPFFSFVFLVVHNFLPFLRPCRDSSIG